MVPHVITSDKVAFFDVDDTLVSRTVIPSVDPIGIGGYLWYPIREHIEHIKQYAARPGQKVIVWSAGGWEWAETVVQALGLRSYVDYIMSKPAWYYDDMKAEDILPEVNRVFLRKL